MNIHTPERQAHESMADYRARRAMSKRHVKAITSVNGGKQTSRQLHRADRQKNGSLKGTYGQGLMNQFDRQRESVCEKKHTQRDENGAFTRTGAQPSEPWQGQKRRMWLAGVSALRGY